jgi:lipoyl(octanoyl) transferase
MKPEVHFRWVKDQSYKDVWDLQTAIHQQLVQNKIERRKLQDSSLTANYQQHQLLFCEHFPVYTLGKSGSMEHLLLTDAGLNSNQIEFFKINRGGDITYHGPGQITGYPIFDLDEFFTDVHKYVRLLEEAVIRLLAEYGLKGMRIPEYTGVWLAPNEKSAKFRKICAIGVHLSRWVSMHGCAFNVSTDLTYFDKIIPCGIVDENKTVTSLVLETGLNLSVNEVGERLKHIFKELFDFELVE